MSKKTTAYICQSCSFESPKWSGQCPSCGEWNTLVETLMQSIKDKKGSHRSTTEATTVRFSDLKSSDQEIQRLSTQMQEFDRVMGGGIVFGSVNLIGGEPGIGKSTLLTHLTLNILTEREKDTHVKRTKNEQYSSSNQVLYIAGEESPQQIGLRIERMQTVIGTDWRERLIFVTSTDVDEVVQSIEQIKPTIVIVDSIQTMETSDLTGAQGSIGQLKECTERLTTVAKRLHVPLFLVGHVTKEGVIAGPKVLEHIVDCVLELSGERTGQYRILRAIKNRFGATDEVGIFEVQEQGLIEVTNPSASFLQESTHGAPGSAIACVIEGTRPMLIEVQALVVRSQLPIPRRIARGIPLAKLQLLTAVLEKFGKIPLSTHDVFVNIVGGMNINEPAVDLAVAMACVSSFENKALAEHVAIAGEVGLLGEIRSVKLIKKRRTEAARLGYGQWIGSDTHASIFSLIRDLFPRSK